MIVLGIETSCDDASVALVDSDREILGLKTYSQISEHKPFKGIVPSLAADIHLNKIAFLTVELLNETKIDLNKVDLIAGTIGPGLVGSLFVGSNFAKGLALSLNKPFVGVNHLMGHALAIQLQQEIAFPFLLLMVSGGHTQIVACQDFLDFKILGTTLDDALGECFDKVAKLLDLEYPGAPVLEQLATKGKPVVPLPKPMLGKDNCDFSFSGLKTAVSRIIGDFAKEDIACSFQHVVKEVIIDRLIRASNLTGIKQIVMAGGVASNKFLRQEIARYLESLGNLFFYPSSFLCVDNGAMIAWAGLQKFLLRGGDSFDKIVKSRWSLEQLEN